MAVISQDQWSGQSHGWRYLAQRLNRDGSVGAWLDNELPLTEVQLTDVLSGPPQLSAKIDPELARLIGADGQPLLDEWGTAIYAEADGIIRAGFVFVQSTFSGAVYTVDGTGFSTYPKGMAYEGVTEFRNVDPIDVVRHIWDHVQTGQNSNLGMLVDADTHSPQRIGNATTDSSGTSQDKPYELNWWSTDDLGGAIDQLAGNTPFDYRERHQWNADHTAVLHHLDFGYPLIGRRQSNLRFVLGENIQVMPDVERDGENYANHVRVLGAGEGSAMVRAEARVDDGRLRRTVTLDAKALTSVTQAQQLARNELLIRSQLETITQVVVRDSGNARIGAWSVGDEIRVTADTDWRESIDLWFRVVEMTFTPDKPDIVAMTLAKSGHRAALPTSVDRLAVQIAAIQDQLRTLSRSPQLPNSSIDNGALTVTAPDSSGAPQTTAIIGRQYDGTSVAATVAGPTPPTPTVPDLTAVVGGVQVVWDGHFVDPQPGFTSPVVAPMDFASVSVEISDDPAFPGLASHANFSSARGGTATVAWHPVGTPLYARLVCWSAAGKFSAPSVTAGPVDSGPVALQDLGFNIADYVGGSTIYFNSTTPTAPDGGFTAGDLWLQDTGSLGTDGQPLYLLYRWDGIEWKLLQDQGIADSLAQATAAQSSASDANALAAAAQATANAKITSFYQTSQPTSGMAAGDFWLDTDDGNKLYRYSGSAWVAVQDAQIQSALTAAGTAQATADGKVQTFYRTSAPANPADHLGVGDLWFDTDDGNKLYRWSGSSWAVAQDTAIGTALANAATAQATASGKITAFYAGTAPTSGMQAGDLWVDSTNQLHRYTGSAWVSIQDAAISQALSDAGTAQATADGKVKLYAQTSAPTGLVAGDVGDLWVDTDDGNKLYRWSSTAWVVAQDQAIQTALANAATAQSTASGKITAFYVSSAPTSGMQAGDLWVDATNQLHRYTGSAWVSIQDAAISTALSAAGTAQATADGKVKLYAQTSAPTGLVAGDVGDLWVDTDDGNKLWRWSGSVWVLAQDAAISTALANAATAQATASGKITAFYAGTAPTSGMQAGDLWVDATNQLHRYTGSAWVSIQDAAISTALANAATAQSTADGKIRLFAQTTAPTGLVAGDVGDLWVDTDDGNKLYTWSGSAWVARQLGNSAIQPNSLVASNVIATGTVSAALLESLLVLATTIIAGDASATHAAMAADGFHVYGASGEEVLRLGTSGNDYLGVVDSAGQLVATVDQTGLGSFAALNVAGDSTFMGTDLIDIVGAASGSGGPGGIGPDGAQHQLGYSTTMNTGVTSVTVAVGSEVGIVELDVSADARRQYLVGYQISWRPNATGLAEMQVRIRDGGTSAPTTSSTQLLVGQHHPYNVGWDEYDQVFTSWHPVTTGTHKLLLTAKTSSGSAGTTSVNNNLCYPGIFVLDMGPFTTFAGSANDGGGTGSAPVTNYVTNQIGPAGGQGVGWWSYRGAGASLGSGTLRTDINSEVVQGLDPSGFNGDGNGQWKFTIPNISGTVTKVQLYLYSNWAYFNSGGKAKLNLTNGPGTASPTLLQSTYIPAAVFPKPGGVTVDLPSSWYTSFRGKTSIGITVGPGSSDETYYLRFDGASARLRIWYSQ